MGTASYISSFTIQQAQDIIYELNKFHVQIIKVKNGSYLDIPVYIGSPLTVSATGMLIRNTCCFDTDAIASIKKLDNPLNFPNLHITKTI